MAFDPGRERDEDLLPGVCTEKNKQRVDALLYVYTIRLD